MPEHIEEIDDREDGHKEDDDFPGGRANLADLKRPGALITNANRQYMSVLQTAQRTITSDDDYRQELKTALWASDEEYFNWCNAYAEAKRYGAPVDWLINLLIARNAGIDGARLKVIMDTISHTTYTLNQSMTGKKGVFNRFFGGNKEGGRNVRSPLS